MKSRLFAWLPVLCVFVAAILLTRAAVPPPSYTWAQTYGVASYGQNGNPLDDRFTGSGNDYPVDIARMPDGGVVVAGQLDLPSLWFHSLSQLQFSDATLVRYAADGSITWQREIRQSNDTVDETGTTHRAPSRVFQIETDANGNIYLLGGKGNPNNGGLIPFVAKVAADGTLVWQNGIVGATATAGNPAENYPLGIGLSTHMCRTNDGGILISTSESRPDTSSSLMVLAHFDGAGALDLYRAYEHGQQYAGTYPVAQSKDGSKYIIFAQYPPQDSSFGATAIVTDTAGNILAERSFPPTDGRYENPRAIIPTADGGFAAISWLSLGLTGEDGVILRKFNSDLSVETFEKIIKTAQQGAFSASSLRELPDGGFLIGGNTSARGAGSGGGADEAALMKIKSDGTLEFVSLLGGPDDEEYADHITVGCNAVAMADGGFAFTIATKSYSIDAAQHKPDWWIVRTDATRKVPGFGGLILDQDLANYSVTDSTRAPDNISTIAPVNYAVAPQTSDAPGFSLVDVGANTGPNQPTVVFQGAAAGGASSPTPTPTPTVTPTPTATPTPTPTPTVNPSATPLSVDASVTSTSDQARGNFARVGDDLVYTVNFHNLGTSRALNLKVETAVPTHLHSDHTLNISVDNGSSLVRTINGSTTAPLGVGATFNGGSFSTVNPIPGSARVTAIVDATHFQISSPATQTATGVANVVYGANFYQFNASDLSISPGGTYVPPTDLNGRDAKISWNVGDLDAGLSNFVRFTVHLGNKVRTEQSVRLPDNYAVFSAANPAAPAGLFTGHDSSAVAVETHIEGPIKFTVAALSNVAAPGGTFLYRLALTNLGSNAVSHAMAIFTEPEFSRFSTAIATVNGNKKPAPINVNARVFDIAGQSDRQIVLDVGQLAPNQTATIDLSFHAQWADPAEVPKLSTIDYAAAFLTDKAFAEVNAAFTRASLPSAAPSSTDFLAFIIDPSRIVAYSRGDSGQIKIPLQGSLANRPKLFLSKSITGDADHGGSADGEEARVNFVKPGGQISFVLIATNTGNSTAADVYLQDRLPDHSILTSARILTALDASAVTPPASGKKKKGPPPPPSPPNVGTLRIVPDPDGQHFSLRGLNLPPHVWMAVQYTATVNSGFSAPPAGTFINADCVQSDCFVPGTTTLKSVSSIGSSSLPHTPAGEYGGGAIQVYGDIVLPEPRARALVSRPGVTDNVSATATQLNALYASNPSVLPLSNLTDGTFIAGVQRYYIHYANLGQVAATGVHLDVPLPTHTVFYRAAFVSLPPNQENGEDGYLPGTVLAPAAVPAGFGISKPAPLTNGTVSFSFSQLPAGYEGDVMVELLISSSAIAGNGSLVGNNALPVIFTDDSTNNAMRTGTMSGPQPKLFGSGRGGTAKLTVTPIADATRVPQIGIAKFIDGPLYQGEPFNVTFVFFNYGDTEARGADVAFVLPQNTALVSETHFVYGSSQFLIDNGTGVPQPGNSMDLFVDALPPHTASAIRYTLTATGPIGSTVDDTVSFLSCRYTGVYRPGVTHDTIMAKPLIPAPLFQRVAITGHPLYQYLFNGGDVCLIDLGGGNIVASGAGNIVASGGGNIVASGGGNIVASGAGNIVASGAGNLIPIGVTNGSTLLANTAAIVASGAGNIFVPQGSSIVASGAGNLVAAGGGAIVASGAGNIVASGAGNLITNDGAGIVASGAGNLFGTGAGQIVASGAGNIVATGGGNIVATGGGNIVATGGGNIISTNGGAIVASGAGNVLASTPNSSAMIQTTRSSIVASGAGNLITNDGGSIANKPSN